MGLTIYSFFVSVLWTDILILLLFCLRRSRLLTYFGLVPLTALILGCILRCFFPFEFKFTHIIHGKEWLRQMDSALTKTIGAFSIAEIAAGIWLIGTVVGLLLFLIRNIQFYRSYTALPSCRNKQVLHVAQKVEESLHVRKALLIRSEGIDMPMTTGLTRPVVMLPALDYTDEELEYVLVHELTHWKNHDLWVKLIIRLTCAVFWWNPFVYLLRKDLDQTLELKCDLAVTGQKGREEKTKYLETILKTLRATTDKSFQPTLTTMSLFGSDRKEAEQRFRFVLQYHPNRKRDRFLILMTTLLLVCSLFLSYSFVIQPKYDPPASEFGEEELTPENTHLVRDEDGNYILVDDFGTKILDDEAAETMIEQGFSIREN